MQACIAVVESTVDMVFESVFLVTSAAGYTYMSKLNAQHSNSLEKCQ